MQADYLKFVDSVESLPVFAQPWWLAAASAGAQGKDGGWDAAVVVEDGEALAAWPYLRWRKYGFTFLTNPPLTPRLGIFFARPYTYAEQHRLTDLLVQQLPRYHYLDCNCHYAYDYWQPLRPHGFEQTTRYSFVLQAGFDAATLFTRFNSNAQRNIRKAEKELQVRELTDVLAFYSLATQSFARKGGRIPYSLDFLAGLDAAAYAHQARRMLFAIDAEGRFHAAVYLVEDDDTVYYLAGGMDETHKDSGAMSLLFWHAIQWAAQTGRTFDCEGSSDPGIARFFMGFGTRAKPYHHVFKYNSRLFRLVDTFRY